jgi:tetratricopeptide (TPR) repeat protein
MALGTGQPRRWRAWAAGLVVLGTGLALWARKDSQEPGPVAAARPRAQATALSQAPAEAPLRIVRLSATPLDVVVGGRSTLSCEVQGGRGQARYTWVASRGRVEGSGPTATWVAPKTPGVYQVGVVVEEGEARAKESVVLQVHVPRAEDMQALLQSPEWRQAREQEQARQGEVEAQLNSLREVVARRETKEDRLRAFFALEELAALLLAERRYEEALAAYEELLGSLLETEPKRKKYLAGKASALLALGREEEALEAYRKAGDYNHSMSYYYAALLLESRGQVEEALEAYRKATEANRWFSDPLLRYASMLLQQGRPEREVLDMLIAASPRYGREVLLERLAADPRLERLNRALQASGRAVELEEQRPIESAEPPPPPAPEPGRNSVVVRERP